MSCKGHICSFHKYKLSTYYVPTTLPGARAPVRTRQSWLLVLFPGTSSAGKSTQVYKLGPGDFLILLQIVMRVNEGNRDKARHKGIAFAGWLGKASLGSDT